MGIGAVLAEVERHQPVRQAGMRGMPPAELPLALGEDTPERLLLLLEALDVPDAFLDGPAASEEELQQEFAPELFFLRGLAAPPTEPFEPGLRDGIDLPVRFAFLPLQAPV